MVNSVFKKIYFLEGTGIHIVVFWLSAKCLWLALLDILTGLHRTLPIPSFSYVINRKEQSKSILGNNVNGLSKAIPAVK